MKLITVRMDMCYTPEGDTIPLRTEEEIAQLAAKAAEIRKAAKKSPEALGRADMFDSLVGVARAMRAQAQGETKMVEVSFPRPTGADKVEIRSSSVDETDDGRRFYNPEREPPAALITMLMKPDASWNLCGDDGKVLDRTAENIKQVMPVALQDAVYAEIQTRLYPLQARVDFLPVLPPSSPRTAS